MAREQPGALLGPHCVAGGRQTYFDFIFENHRIGCLEGSSLVTRLNCHAGDVNVDGSGVYTSRVAAPASQTLQLVIECREDTAADQILTRPAILGRSTIFVW